MAGQGEAIAQVLEPAQAEQMTKMLYATHRGPVFGEGVAFGEIDEARQTAIFGQAATMVVEAGAALTEISYAAMPDYPPEAVKKNVLEKLPKAIAFVPMLTVGELTTPENTANLVQTAVSIGCMYIPDELIDRGDKKMPLAVREYVGDLPFILAEDRPLVTARQGLVTNMEQAITTFAGQDAPDVLYCYAQLVLANEVRLQALSGTYAELTHRGDGYKAFLGHHAVRIANMMAEDAGVQSVTSSLHSIYRKNDDSLPSIRELHSHPEIQELLQVCNTAARVADERGDWWMDAGKRPEYGIFSINPFNQYHPRLVERLCNLAGITEPGRIKTIDDNVYGFHTARDSDIRDAYGTEVTHEFFEQTRRQFEQVKGRVPANYRKYVELCMRVMEIAHVNMEGDIKMGGAVEA